MHSFINLLLPRYDLFMIFVRSLLFNYYVPCTKLVDDSEWSTNTDRTLHRSPTVRLNDVSCQSVQRTFSYRDRSRPLIQERKGESRWLQWMYEHLLCWISSRNGTARNIISRVKQILVTAAKNRNSNITIYIWQRAASMVNCLIVPDFIALETINALKTDKMPTDVLAGRRL